MIMGFRLKEHFVDEEFLKWVDDSNARKSFFVKLKIHCTDDLIIVDSEPLMFNTAPLFGLFSVACVVFGWTTMAFVFAGVFVVMMLLQSKALYFFTMVKALKKYGSKVRIGWN